MEEVRISSSLHYIQFFLFKLLKFVKKSCIIGQIIYINLLRVDERIGSMTPQQPGYQGANTDKA